MRCVPAADPFWRPQFHFFQHGLRCRRRRLRGPATVASYTGLRASAPAALRPGGFAVPPALHTCITCPRCLIVNTSLLAAGVFFQEPQPGLCGVILSTLFLQVPVSIALHCAGILCTVSLVACLASFLQNVKVAHGPHFAVGPSKPGPHAANTLLPTTMGSACSTASPPSVCIRYLVTQARAHLGARHCHRRHLAIPWRLPPTAATRRIAPPQEELRNMPASRRPEA